MPESNHGVRPTSRTVLDVRVDVLLEQVRRHQLPDVEALRKCPRVAGWLDPVFDQALAEAIRRGLLIDAAGPGEPLIALPEGRLAC